MLVGAGRGRRSSTGQHRRRRRVRGSPRRRGALDAAGRLGVVAVAVLLYGALPRFTGLAWAVLIVFLVLGEFGALIGLPGWLVDLSRSRTCTACRAAARWRRSRACRSSPLVVVAAGLAGDLSRRATAADIPADRARRRSVTRPDTVWPMTGIPGFWAVIPAGGSGTRLWPLSRRHSPKFLHDLTGSGQSLLRATWDRLEPLVGERMLVVTGASHEDAVRRQLPMLGRDAVVAEPSPRDSMPAIGLAAAILERRDPEAVLG